MSPSKPKPTPNRDPEPATFDFINPPTSTSSTWQPALLSTGTIKNYVGFYFTNMHTTACILDRQTLAETISTRLATDSEVYCLTASICAFVMVQPGVNLAVAPGGYYDGEPPENRFAYTNMLLEDITRVRKSINYIGSPTLSSVQISFFLFSCYFSLEEQNMCWFHLREAATLAQILNMHEESSYLAGDPVENSYKRRMYWLLLVTERAYAIERHRPLSLHATIDLPTAQGAAEEQIISGFLHLASLFRYIDDTFMTLWNKAKGKCTAVWLSQLQHQLSSTLPSQLETTESQVVDIKITLHWLRIMVWQLSIASGRLSSSSPDPSLTFKFPVQVARDLIQDVRHISLNSMEVHGIGLIEKLFDVACTLTDIISYVPLEPSANIEGETPVECLNQFLGLISQLRGGSSRYLPLLVEKISDNLQSIVPRVELRQMDIKQGHAGATENIPKPAPSKRPRFLMLTWAHDQRPRGAIPESDSQAQQQKYHDQGQLPAACSPSTQESDTSTTPSSYSGSSGYTAQQQTHHPLAPAPRCVPSMEERSSLRHTLVDTTNSGQQK
ncbi:hypothetical protein A1O3_00120 [Capronia epimyces CBS 606.96]|uniref:Uncharacterized protein n=1 Tax=Capronia epimyces CBS 606.96 TaxID=1182542 RepID=W9YFA8_9EURO|nr:uncharacterized protein A1O3_00120 [Capronia epimyces CBS 606.96]EXJ91572.1 hypothetical protein A1O3_00120 [Capronia epimyces CBS 606.96]